MQCTIGLGCHKGENKDENRYFCQNKVALWLMVMTQKIDFWCGWVSEEIEKKLKIANNCSKIPWENI